MWQGVQCCVEVVVVTLLQSGCQQNRDLFQDFANQCEQHLWQATIGPQLMASARCN
jgi:hypothetical protein